MAQLFKYILSVFVLLVSLSLSAQTTINNDSKPIVNSGVVKKGTKHKVLIIPFEPRMYMSHIDHKINAETKWSQKKIKEAIRFGLDEELYKCIKKKQEVMSFLDDSVKYKKELFKTYSAIQYKYDKIPDQNKYTAPKTEKEIKAIQKGQIVADSDNEGKFMNVKVKDNTLLGTFTSKYKTDVFLFINQIDITSSEVPGALNNSVIRTITVHYTIFSANGKEINSGISSVNFPPTVNHPDKIASDYLSKIAQEIVVRLEKSLTLPN